MWFLSFSANWEMVVELDILLSHFTLTYQSSYSVKILFDAIVTPLTIKSTYCARASISRVSFFCVPKSEIKCSKYAGPIYFHTHVSWKGISLVVFTNFAATLATQPSAASLAPRLNHHSGNKDPSTHFLEAYLQQTLVKLKFLISQLFLLYDC